MKRLWEDERIPPVSNLREELKEKIFALSEDWKATQARGMKRPSESTETEALSDREVEGLINSSEEKGAPSQVPDSDDEPILVESSDPVQKSGKPRIRGAPTT